MKLAHHFRSNPADRQSHSQTLKQDRLHNLVGGVSKLVYNARIWRRFKFAMRLQLQLVPRCLMRLLLTEISWTGPVLVGPCMTSDLTAIRTSYCPTSKPCSSVHDRNAGIHGE